MNKLVRPSGPYYHISLDNHDGEIFEPRVPKNRMNWEDDQTPRICFAEDLYGCLQAIDMMPLPRMEQFFFVHEPILLHDHTDPFYYPTRDEVPDVNETGEVWCLDPVEMKCTSFCMAWVDHDNVELHIEELYFNPDPNLDRDELIDQYYRDFYGK